MPLIRALGDYRQFIVVLLAYNAAKGKHDKFPADHRSGVVCDAHDPAVWTDHATAVAAAARLGEGYGLGFVLADTDPFFCVDIDHAAQAGTWSPLALEVCGKLPGTVVERSVSGTGLHVWGRRRPMPAHTSRNSALHLELYHTKRFIALGTDAVGEMADECLAIDAFVAQFFPPRETVGGAELPDDGPRADWRGPGDDAELIRRACMAQSARTAFGGGASFADLWHGDERVLAAAYPPDNAHDAFNRSAADAALLQHLAFWTGCDRGRMRRLLVASALAREKHEREDYLERSLDFAVSHQRDVLQDRPIEPAPAPQGAGPETTQCDAAPRVVEGSTFLGVTEQVEFFRGCFYVRDMHKVLVPGGHLLNPERFRASYGGYTFAMDLRNERTTRNAFEALTESQALRAPRVDGVCFRPQLPYGAIVADAGRTRANQWWPVEVPCEAGDVTPFTTHMAKLLPHGRDQLSTVCWLASAVQNPGVKFQVALVLQGVEGNGKTVLSRILMHALGARYVHWPKAAKIAGHSFNSWLLNKLLYCVEDIYTSESTDVLEELKPMITGGDGLEIEAKGVDQVSSEVCGNFIINTNHKNGLRKTVNDRRMMVHYTAQQVAEDLVRDGMDGDYMPRLYAWLENGGYAAVTHYLRTYPIPEEFNFARGCHRAPRTSSTDEAIEQGLGRVEQEIVEAVEQGRPGFLGGWISSLALDKLLRDLKLDGRAPRARRRDILRTLGYEMHPALPQGRVNNPVLPDGAKPRLYLRPSLPAWSLTSSVDVARAYSLAQQVA